MAEVQPLQYQFPRLALLDEPVQHPADLGAQEPTHVLHQRPVATAVARLAPGALLAGGDQGRDDFR